MVWVDIVCWRHVCVTSQLMSITHGALIFNKYQSQVSYNPSYVLVSCTWSVNITQTRNSRHQVDVQLISQKILLCA
jgi:hypothetical protein